jgi:hypothetical protein
MYADFKLLMENDRIKIVYHDGAKKQMESLAFKKTPRGYLTVENSSDSVHDDIPDSIAMLINVSIKPNIVTPGFNFFDYDDKKAGVKEDGMRKTKKEIIDSWNQDLSDEDIDDILEANKLRGIGNAQF